MKQHNNDNTNTWIELAAATANLVRYLEPAKEKQEDRERDAQRSGDEEKKKEEQRAYIEQRLRDLSAFEELFRTWYRSGRKRE